MHLKVKVMKTQETIIIIYINIKYDAVHVITVAPNSRVLFRVTVRRTDTGSASQWLLHAR